MTKKELQAKTMDLIEDLYDEMRIYVNYNPKKLEESDVSFFIDFLEKFKKLEKEWE